MITQERKRAVFDMLERLEAYEEIQNQMGRTIAAMNFRQPEQILEAFALNQTDVSFELADEGLFEGAKAVKAIVRETFNEKVRPGEMLDLQLTTPMIEVAADGGSAEAVWWCPGAGAMYLNDDKPDAVWVWGMIAADFIKIENVWKIWHLHYFRLIKCSYKKGWVEDTSMIHRANTAMHPLSRPTTYHNPYSPNAVREGIPACPRPYETYTDKMWMLERDKTK